MENTQTTLDKLQQKITSDIKSERRIILNHPYNMNQVLDVIKMFGTAKEPDFSIDEQNHKVFEDLIMYFNGDSKFELNAGYSLEKGIMICGGYGTGKSLLMEVFSSLTNMRNAPPNQKFKIAYCTDIVKALQTSGPNALQKYEGYDYVKSKNQIWCFDDLGAEDSLSKYYGNEVNAMANIFYSRYLLFTRYGVPTHVTTNLLAEEIEFKYGDRIRSRFRQMFNYLILDGDDRRK